MNTQPYLNAPGLLCSCQSQTVLPRLQDPEKHTWYFHLWAPRYLPRQVDAQGSEAFHLPDSSLPSSPALQPIFPQPTPFPQGASSFKLTLQVASSSTSPRPTHRSGVLTLTSLSTIGAAHKTRHHLALTTSTRDLFFLSASPAFSNGHCLRPREDNVHHSITHHRQPSFGSRSSGQGKEHFIFFFRPVFKGKCPHRQPSTLRPSDLHIVNPRSVSSTHANLPNRPQHTHPARVLFFPSQSSVISNRRAVFSHPQTPSAQNFPHHHAPTSSPRLLRELGTRNPISSKAFLPVCVTSPFPIHFLPAKVIPTGIESCVVSSSRQA